MTAIQLQCPDMGNRVRIVAPDRRIGIDVHFDHDAIGIMAIQRLTDAVIGLSGKCHAVRREVVAKCAQFVQRIADLERQVVKSSLPGLDLIVYGRRCAKTAHRASV